MTLMLSKLAKQKQIPVNDNFISRSLQLNFEFTMRLFLFFHLLCSCVCIRIHKSKTINLKYATACNGM